MSREQTFFQVVRIFRSNGEERHAAFFLTEEEAVEHAEENPPCPLEDVMIYHCVFGTGNLRCQIACYTPKGAPHVPTEQVVTLRKADGRTTCCNAFTTFADEIECCRACFAGVGNAQVGTKTTVARSR